MYSTQWFSTPVSESIKNREIDLAAAVASAATELKCCYHSAIFFTLKFLILPPVSNSNQTNWPLRHLPDSDSEPWLPLRLLTNSLTSPMSLTKPPTPPEMLSVNISEKISTLFTNRISVSNLLTISSIFHFRDCYNNFVIHSRRSCHHC